jgi:hypothetical protein
VAAHYGKNLVRQQHFTIRMADVAMDLFSLSAAMIKLKQDDGRMPAFEKMALEQYVKTTKERVDETLPLVKVSERPPTPRLSLKLHQPDDKALDSIADKAMDFYQGGPPEMDGFSLADFVQKRSDGFESNA